MAYDEDRLPDPVAYYESQGYKLVGPRKAPWKTTECRFHGGSDSMRILVATGAFRCMNCCAKGKNVLSFHMAEHGLDFVTAAKELGAWVEDGRPPKHRRPPAFSPLDAIRIAKFEITLAAVIAGNMDRGVNLSAVDRERLQTCAGRLNHIAEGFD